MSGRILVVEDEPDVRDLMVLHLKRAGHEVASAENGEEALRLLGRGRFDLVVLDWMLPGLSGLEVCREVAGKLRVLMVTARADSSDIVRGLETGADDYVVKPFELPVFLARVGALMRRQLSAGGAPAPAVRKLTAGAIELDEDSHEVVCAGMPLELTISEFRLLATLMENAGRALSRDRLIAQVQGEGVFVSDRTIDTHVFGLRKKLGEHGNFIETIRGVGYRIKGTPGDADR